MKLPADVCALLRKGLVGGVDVGVALLSRGLAGGVCVGVGVGVGVGVDRLVTGGLTGTGALLAPVRVPIGCIGMELRRLDGLRSSPTRFPIDAERAAAPAANDIADARWSPADGYILFMVDGCSSLMSKAAKLVAEPTTKKDKERAVNTEM